MSKKLSQNMRDDIVRLAREGFHTNEITEEVGVSKSTVYRVLRDANNIHTEVLNTEPSVRASFTLAAGESAEVKLCDEHGRIVATLEMDAEGMMYRRPKAKVKNGKLSWDMLDRLSGLGLK